MTATIVLWERRIFQSTRPIRGATSHNIRRPSTVHISIHAPHTGRDDTAPLLGPGGHHFNPRAPYGARPVSGNTKINDKGISIHAPHTGRDHGVGTHVHRHIAFQSTRPIRGATPALPGSRATEVHFNPRAPYGARRVRCSTTHMLSYFNPRAPYGARLSSPPVEPAA